MKKSDPKSILNKILHALCITSFILSILGVVEYITSYNIFNILETSNVDSINYSQYIRAGHLRIATSFPHSLAYGLFLILMIPITLHQIRNNRSSVFYRTLLVLLFINVLMTSSRSIMISLCLSFVVYFILSNLKRKIIVFYTMFLIGIPVIVFSATPLANNIPVISNIGDNVKSLSDTFLGTHLVDNYGMNSEPFSYRLVLINYAFNQTESENIIGKGIGFIRDEPLVFNIPEINPYAPTISYSVDNYYVNQKLELGWVGLITTLLFFVSVLFKIFKYRKADFYFTILFIGMVGYLFQLVMVNELETIKYIWILLAIFSSYLSFKKAAI